MLGQNLSKVEITFHKVVRKAELDLRRLAAQGKLCLVQRLNINLCRWSI